MNNPLAAKVILVIATVLAVVAPSRAHAEVGLSLPAVVDDARRGARFGNFIFIPSVGLEGRYNSNVFRQDSREGRSEAAVLTLRPGFKLLNPTPSWLKLTWDASVDVNFWFSKDPNADKQGRVAAETSLRADFLVKSVVGFFIADRFIRSVQPQNYSTSRRYDWNFKHAEIGLQVRPTGALQFDLSYAFNFNLFDSFKDGDRFYHQARLLGTWAFFPKTSLFLDVDWRYQDWSRDKVDYRVDSMPLRAVLGVRGYLTKKVALDVRAGYGQGFVKQGTDVQTFIGGASFAFKPTPFTLLDLGYDRNFEDAAFYGRWYIADSAHLSIKQQFARRLELSGAFTYSYLSFGRVVPKASDVSGLSALSASQADRRDHSLGARIGLSYSAVRYLTLRVGYEFEAIVTDFRLVGTDAAGKTSTDFGGYKLHQVFGEITVLY